LRFLLNENVPLSLKNIIESLGYEVITLKDENKLRLKNGQVAEFAIKKNATIITLDSDFLHLKNEIQLKSKIIYVKVHPRDPKIIGKIIKLKIQDIIKKLNMPGKVILTIDDIKYEFF